MLSRISAAAMAGRLASSTVPLVRILSEGRLQLRILVTFTIQLSFTLYSAWLNDSWLVRRRPMYCGWQ